MYIIIVGVGKVGYFLAKELVSKGHEVTIIEEREDRHSRVESEVGCTAFLGKGDDPSVLEEAGIERADVLVACTGHDEDNLVISHVAKMLYPKVRVVARVNHPKNEDIFRRVGIDAIANGTSLFANVIEHELTQGDLVPLMTLRRSGMEIVEVTVRDDSPCVGHQVQDLHLPSDSVLITIIRADHAMVPRGGTELQPGDEIVALVRTTQEEELRRALMGEWIASNNASRSYVEEPKERPRGLRGLLRRG